MKILYSAYIRLPTEKAHGAQIMKTCEALADAGASVELVIPGRKTHIHEDPFSYYGVKENFVITTLKTPDLVRFGRAGFVLSAVWFSERVRFSERFRAADIIFSRDALVLLQYLLLRKRLVYEAHVKPTAVSKFVARRAYRVIAISQRLRTAYLQAGVSQKNISVACDAVDVSVFKREYNQEMSCNRLGIPNDRQIALYVGRIDAAKGVETFAAASEHLPENMRCVLIGSGPLKESLRQKYKKAFFLEETPYRDLPQVLASADVLVIPNSARDVDASTYTSPLKVFAYLASGKPIVASDVPSVREVLNEKNAFFTPPDNPPSLAEVLQYALNNPGEAKQKVLRAREDARQYTWEKRAKKILSCIT